MRKLTNKLTVAMLALAANTSFAQTVWDFTDASVWQDKTFTSGSYDATGGESGSTKATFTFEEGTVAYDNGIKITATGSTSSNCIKTPLGASSYTSALVKLTGNETKAGLAYIYNKKTTAATATGKYICVSNPNNNTKAASGCWLYASALADGGSIVVEKIATYTTASETSLEIGSTGIATLYPATVVTIKDPSAFKAYVIKSIDNGVAVLEEVPSGQSLAGFQGYIIKGTANSTCSLSIARGAAELDTDNMLKGSVAATTVNSDANTSRYFLAADAEGNVAFKKVATATESDSRKAWLEVPNTVSGAKNISLCFPDGETTGISSVKTENTCSDGLYYGLDGVGRKQPSKGINIINGKKVIIK